jgi:hypothetical protein
MLLGTISQNLRHNTKKQKRKKKEKKKRKEKFVVLGIHDG